MIFYYNTNYKQVDIFKTDLNLRYDTLLRTVPTSVESGNVIINDYHTTSKKSLKLVDDQLVIHEESGYDSNMSCGSKRKQNTDKMVQTNTTIKEMCAVDQHFDKQFDIL